jgi:glutamate-1-semialdehyde 2,1-aminomutase
MQQSNQLFEQSLEAIPGGVNSPVRAFQGVGGTPVFIARGKGSRLYDVDDREYVDYVCSWGAMIVGHAHKDVVAAAAAAATSGISFGAPTEIEYRFADTIRRAMPSIEMVRAVNSGTEATMSAIRLARGYTGRDLLIKFAGCYHGHADSLLVAAGSGVLTQGLPASEGVPAAAVADTLVLPYNDAQAVTDAFLQYGERIATVIVEPIAGNMNLVRGNDDFLRTLRQQTEKYGSVLIFDEVMSGFRVAAGGAQQLLNIRPDLTCLGKVIGGGLGVAAFGGRQDIMHTLAPLGSVYQAGTLSGNPVALSAGLATLDIVLQEGFHDNLHAATARLTKGLTDAANQSDTPFCCDHIGGMWGMYFRSTPPQNLSEAQDVNMISFRQFFHLMLKKGFYFAPSSYEAGFGGVIRCTRTVGIIFLKLVR